MSERPRYRLEDLLAGMTEENRQPEFLTGPAVGREFPNGYPPPSSETREE